MRSHWKELLTLPGTAISTTEGTWTIRHSHILEDQGSSRLALFLDLERGSEVISARLLFSGDTHFHTHGNKTDWILDALKDIIEGGELRQDGIYSIE